MASNDPLDLYIAAYSDEAAAQQDWDALKRLAKDKVVRLDGLVLVRRDTDGTIHVKDNAHDAGIGAAIGAVGGALVGLIFPPSILAAAVIGGGIGAGAGAVTDLVQKHGVKADLEEVLVPGSSGVVAVFEERWVSEVEKALSRAEKADKHHLHEAVPES